MLFRMNLLFILLIQKKIGLRFYGPLKTLDPKKVADRYSKNGVLLPTMKDDVRHDYAGIEDYFVSFLQNEPTGEILGRKKILTLRPIPLYNALNLVILQGLCDIFL